MIYRKNSNTPRNPLSFLISIGIAVLVLVALFMLARFIFTILMYAAPILLVAALIIDYKTVVNYGKWLIALTKRQTILGIVAIVLTVVGFPVVAAFLFGKALLTNRLKDKNKTTQQQEEQAQLGEYIDYEEVKEEKIDLSQFERRKDRQTRNRGGNEYERLFDEDR